MSTRTDRMMIISFTRWLAVFMVITCISAGAEQPINDLELLDLYKSLRVSDGMDMAGLPTRG